VPLFICRAVPASLLREVKGIAIHMQNDEHVSEQRDEGVVYFCFYEISPRLQAQAPASVKCVY